MSDRRRPASGPHALTGATRCPSTPFGYLLLPIAVVILFSFNDPSRPLQLHLAGLHARQLENWDAVPGMRSAIELVARDRGAREHRRDGARHADRARARPLRLPRPRRDEPAHLPADVDARDRARRLAADAVPHPGRRLGFWTIFIAHVMFMHHLRRRHGQGAADRLRPPPRGGGDGPRRERVDDVPQGDAAAHRAGDPRRGAARRSRSRSTTS